MIDPLEDKIERLYAAIERLEAAADRHLAQTGASAARQQDMMDDMANRLDRTIAHLRAAAQE